jgi:hypothetical protein
MRCEMGVQAHAFFFFFTFPVAQLEPWNHQSPVSLYFFLFLFLGLCFCIRISSSLSTFLEETILFPLALLRIVTIL